MWCTAEEDGTTLLYIRPHLVHEVHRPQASRASNSPAASPAASNRGRDRRPQHATTGWGAHSRIEIRFSRLQGRDAHANIKEYAQGLFPFLDKRQDRARDRAGAGATLRQ